jgi:hypothetical protein
VVAAPRRGLIRRLALNVQQVGTAPMKDALMPALADALKAFD